MSNILPTPPSFTFGYWRPWKENSNYFDSYYNYAKDVSLAKYQADTVGQYISQASSEQVQAIGELADKIGFAVEAIEELGNKINRGFSVLSSQMTEMNQQLDFLNKNLDIQIEQQKVTNLLLENISELLRVPDSEKERQHNIELGLKFFVNAQKDDDLFADALEELLEAEKLMKQDYFVLHRIGLIYMYSLKHINPQKALDYFAKAAKYASVESDPKAVRLANALVKYGGSRVNTKVLSDTNAIEYLAADSYEKAAFAAYVLGNFDLAVTHQSKALKYNKTAENHFFLAKYQSRIKQIELCIQNLEKAIDESPSMFYAVFKDLDLVNEPKALDLIYKKNITIKLKILQLRKEIETNQNDTLKPAILKLENLLNDRYDKKINIYNYYIESIKRNWAIENLNVNYFQNGDEITEAKTIDDFVNAGNEEKPVWCYYENDPANGVRYGKLYNWYAVNDPRGLAPLGWHVPSLEEWEKFINNLGGRDKAALKIKSTYGWYENGNGTDEIGFAALPGGLLFYNSEKKYYEFDLLGIYGYWWSSTSKDKDYAYELLIGFDKYYNLYFSEDYKKIGISVRCISDNALNQFNNKITDNQIYKLIHEFELVNSDCTNILVTELKEALKTTYVKKNEVLVSALESNCRNYALTNLNVRRFRNGDLILEVTTSEEWLDAVKNKIPAWCCYDFNPMNSREFGKLYNWYAVIDSRGLAPKGWRIPKLDDLEIINQNKNDFYNQMGGGCFYSNHFDYPFHDKYWVSSSINILDILHPYTLCVKIEESKICKITDLICELNDGFPVRCIKE